MARRGRYLAATAVALVVVGPLTLMALSGAFQSTAGYSSGSTYCATCFGGPAAQSSRNSGTNIGSIAEGLHSQSGSNIFGDIADSIASIGRGSNDRTAELEVQMAPTGRETVQGQRPVTPEMKTALDEMNRLAQGQLSGGMPSPQLARPAPQIMPSYDISPVLPAPGDEFTRFATSATKSVQAEPVSTFSVDVDTASYSYVRRSIESGVLPPRDSVRVEELVNYFPYAYRGPDSPETPFLANVAVVDNPWRPGTKLMHVGIKGWEVPAATRPAANLVFLVDTSGSMQSPDKLPLLQASLRMMVNALQDRDTVSIVTYAGSSAVLLEQTPASDRNRIVSAIDGLSAGGGTAGSAGIETAYALAERGKMPGGINRVVLATDGDFNVGISDPSALKDFISRKRETGVFLSVLGFGTGNLGDDTMQALAQNGNGTAAYIDSMSEARKVLVDQIGSSVVPIAKDVKIQVEFNPATVSEYRLVGYETRALAREDFKNDRVDAGDIGSGHTVTAVYEIVPIGSQAALVDDLRYGKPEEKQVAPPTGSSEYAFVKIRYKLPDGSVSKLVETPVTPTGNDLPLARTSDDVRFSLAVAAFAQKLRGESETSGVSFEEIAAMAAGAKGDDAFGYRDGFIDLVRTAAALSPR